MTSEITLDKLYTGTSGKISAVGGVGALRRRMLDLGLTPGTTIMVRKVAPLGDPIELFLRGYELSLRKDEASCITVIPDGKPKKKPGDEQAARPEQEQITGMEGQVEADE